MPRERIGTVLELPPAYSDVAGDALVNEILETDVNFHIHRPPM
jgi:hypothetical protein